MTTAFLLVDAQRNMLEGEFPVPNAAEITPLLADLLGRARSAGAVVVQVQNDGPADSPDKPGTAGWELFFPTADDDIVVRKTESDAFAGTDLAATLGARHVDRVVVAGMQSEYCIDASSRGALRHGLAVELAAGAHSTYDDDQDAAAISAGIEDGLASAGVKVVPAADIDFS